MPTEQLILRRVFPVPVTFADLRRAFYDSFIDGDGGQLQTCRAEMERAIHRADKRPNAAKNARAVLASIHSDWHAAIKEATGAVDEVYAVIDGREVRVAIVENSGLARILSGGPHIGALVNVLMTKADEDGYWQRPHEVRHVLEESQMSTRTMARIAANSIIAAGAK